MKPFDRKHETNSNIKFELSLKIQTESIYFHAINQNGKNIPSSRKTAGSKTAQTVAQYNVCVRQIHLNRTPTRPGNHNNNNPKAPCQL